MGGLLLLPKGQLAQEVEESADLMRGQAVHVVQGSLRPTSHTAAASNPIIIIMNQISSLYYPTPHLINS